MQDNKPQLFGDSQSQEKVQIREPLWQAKGYFKDMPFGFVLIFAWFSYLGFSSLYHALQSLALLVFLRHDYFSYPYFSLIQPYSSVIVSIVAPLAYLAMLWGFIKQAGWTKIAVIIWYCLALILLGYTMYPILQLIGFGSQNEFYYQGGVNGTAWVSFAVAGITLGINTWALYYLFKKINLGSWK